MGVEYGGASRQAGIFPTLELDEVGLFCNKKWFLPHLGLAASTIYPTQQKISNYAHDLAS